MATYGIDVLCIQETRKPKADVYFEHDHQIVLSGADCDGNTWAGVGFIIAPRLRRYVKSYKQVSDRVCVLKLRVQSKTLGLLGVYAPHNQRPPEERIDFFNALDKEYRSCYANYGKLILGDLNARVGQARPGEDEVIGLQGWGREAVRQVERPNRDLLFELCFGNGLIIANTFLSNKTLNKK